MQQATDQLGLIARLKAPTPSFFKKFRTIGILIAAVGTSIVTGPIAVPLIVTKIAGYLAVAGGVITAVSQATVRNPEPTPSADESEGGSYDKQ